MISVARWGQLGDGELFARSRYVDWALMMKRTWGFDVLRCPRCSRKMRVLATLVDPVVVRQILEHLGVRASPLPRAPPRDPEAYARPVASTSSSQPSRRGSGHSNTGRALSAFD